MIQNVAILMGSDLRSIIREEFLTLFNQLGPTAEKTQRPITTKELCDHLGVTEPTIRRWKKKGVIPYFTIGSAVRFHLADVITSLEKRRAGKRVI